ncbi:carbohydrate kinase family protein [Streptomyces sp. TLI_185]|uniref:carbohydrate kinase family protein n=1 Tax=Streptomyces sp. TLI_185 TaxID=2485151 RepID=UPI000F4E5468|nr:carbohydrate kinase family protein [Streptomyces sp. TLI_185]RPF24903.1 adenosine kinase [Streptomyces sp. TLI_185]
MRIAVTGSIATDHLMRFQGRFVDQILPDKLDHVSLSFLVDDLQVRRGGVASNIAFGLGQLGLRPVLVGAVGRDFEEYDEWLRRHGVDTHSLHTSRAQHTARFLCTTDDDGNQIASFYAGAMSEASAIDLGAVSQHVGGLDLVLVGANDPEAMLRHTHDCRTAGLPFAADPSQQLARLQGDAIRDLVTGAEYLFTNEYEATLLLIKTGWTADDVLARVSTWVTTLGRKGCRIQQQGERAIEVSAVPVTEAEAPTGVGDGFRAGFLAALAWGLTSTRAAQLGCAVAANVLCASGPQEYQLDGNELLSLCRSSYGPETAYDLSRRLSHLR